MILRLACLILVATSVAGCDKCGNRVKFNTPSMPNTCGANADSQ
jgi:hypothetical protein